jgi:hypothetical protein
MKAKLLGCSALVALASVANAQITAVGPFTGSHQEPFEAVPSYSCPPCFLTCLTDVFSNTATMCDANGGNGMHITGSWGFMCTIFPHGGGRLFGSAGGPTLITFNDPIAKFGGYMGSHSGSPDATIEFFDAGGASLGTQTATIPADCSWNWNGWESTSANIKSIKITGLNPFGGGFVLLDDLEYDGAGGGQCYPDCDGDQALTLADFGCFQTKFALGDLYADCNGDLVLNLADFGCFQTEFAIGCP